jgi:hypothetical protein
MGFEASWVKSQTIKLVFAASPLSIKEQRLIRSESE